MKKSTYIKMTGSFRKHTELAGLLHIGNKIVTSAVFVAYPILLVWLYAAEDSALYRAITVPLDGFIIITVIRRMINRRRPYEVFETPPVISKDTKARSFPSRHVFSAAIIAFTFLEQPGMTWVAVVLGVCTMILGVIRILAGVHYISDVAAAQILAAVIWFVGYHVIP